MSLVWIYVNASEKIYLLPLLLIRASGLLAFESMDEQMQN